jgi:hypothetical protein
LGFDLASFPLSSLQICGVHSRQASSRLQQVFGTRATCFRGSLWNGSG